MNSWVFLLYVAATLGQFLDDRTTEVALAHGFVEANPIGKWLISKVGVQGMYFVKTAALPVAVTIFAALHPHYGMPLQVLVAGLGWGVGVANALKLRKAKIAVL